MIQNLPPDIQQLIYNNTHVDDRLNYWLALPKSSRDHMQKKCSTKEKTLSILHKSVKKNRVSALSEKMKDFLRTCDPLDPTIQSTRLFKEFASAEIKPVCTPHLIVSSPILLEKIKNGTLTREEAVAIIDDDFDMFWTLQRTIYIAHENSFQMLFEHNSEYKRTILQNQFTIIFNMVNYNNDTLLRHLLANPTTYIGFDVTSAVSEVMEMLCKGDNMTVWVYSHKTALTLPFTLKHLEDISKHTLDYMMMDAAASIGKAIDNIQETRTLIMPE